MVSAVVLSLSCGMLVVVDGWSWHPEKQMRDRIRTAEMMRGMCVFMIDVFMFLCYWCSRVVGRGDGRCRRCHSIRMCRGRSKFF